MNKQSVGIIGRNKNQLELEFDGNIDISTNQQREESIVLDRTNESILITAKEIVLDSQITGEDFSVVYGERLIEFMKWVINVLKTHSHPPNATPVPDFFPEADKWIQTMENYVLNQRVRTR